MICHCGRARGLTLVELLVCLVLLSSLMLAIVSWTQAMARSGAELAVPHAWRSSAQRVIGLIQDDLQSGDWQLPDEGVLKLPSRLRLEDGDLLIRTRSLGPVLHRYRFDGVRHELFLIAQTIDESGALAPSRPRRLMQHVKFWSCLLESLHESRSRHRLSITIGPVNGTSITEVFYVEEEV